MDFISSKENKLSASRVMKDNSLVGVDPPGLATSLVPRPLPFFVLRFAFSINTEVEEHEKRERPGNTYHVNDVRWTRGGHRGGGVRIRIHEITC